MQKYDHGSIYYTAATGAHVIEGSIGAKWIAAGAQAGFLGYPTNDIQSGLKNSGSAQSFVTGTIAYSPATGVHTARGGIGARWITARAQNGALGYPITDEIAGARGGVYQRYQGGLIYWTGFHGAQIMRGGIYGFWASMGAERSRLGYPVTEESGLRSGGASQAFEGGAVVYSPTTGAHSIVGGILNTWGWEYVAFGKLGYPITNEMGGLKGGGAYQLFQHGAIYYSPATGGEPVYGAIRSAWAATGAEHGPLGYPTTPEVPSFGDIVQNFQTGSIRYSRTHGITDVLFWVPNCRTCGAQHWKP